METRTYKISIIVPVYNPPEQLLKECIESILRQSYRNIELILIDNCSTGKCPEILKQYKTKDKRIKLFRFDENQGFSGACNKGLEMAGGDYIQVVDSDDLLTENACDCEITNMKKNDCDVLVFGNNIFDSNTQKMMPSQNVDFHNFDNKVFSLDDASAEIFHLPMCVWNKLFKKKFLDAFNIRFNDKLRVAAPDCLFSATALCLAAKIGYIDKPLYIYRTNLANSVMNNLSKEEAKLYLQVIAFCDEIYKLMQRIESEKRKYLARFCLEVLNLNFSLTHKNNRRDFYDKMKIFFNKSKDIFEKNKDYLPLFYFYDQAKKCRYKKFKFLISHKIETFKIKLFNVIDLLTIQKVSPPPDIYR